MGIAVPPGGVQCVLRWALTGDSEEMVSTIGASGRGPFGSAQDFAASFAALANTQLSPAAQMSTGYTFVGATVYIYQDGGAAEVGESLVNVAGTAASPALPNNCAFLIRKRTAQAGRRGQGRMFLPPYRIGESGVDQTGVLNAASVNSLQTNVTNFYNAFVTMLDTDVPVLWHSPGGASGTEVFAGTPLTALVVDSKIATQRQRMRR